MSDIGVKVDLLPQIKPEAIQQALNAAASGLKLNISGIQLGNIDTSSITKSIQGATTKAQQSMKLKPDIDMSRLSSGLKQQASSIESVFRSALTKAIKTGNIARANELTSAYDKMVMKAENASKISSSGARKGAESAKQELITLLGEANKADAAVKKFSSTMKSLESSAGKIGGNSSNTAKVAELNSLIERAQTNIKGLGNATSRESSQLESSINRDVQAIQRLIVELQHEDKALKDVAKEQQVLTKSSTLSNNIESWMQKNTKAAERFGTELRELQSQLKNNTDGGKLQDISLKFKNIQSQAHAAGLTTNTFVRSLKDVGLQAAGLGSAVMAFQKVIDTIKLGVQTVVELDDALVDLKKTTTMNDSELNSFYTEANKSAKKYGATTADIIQSAADWSRLGFSDKTSSTTMANLSSMMAVISPGMSVDQATTGLVSIMKAYDINANEVLDGIMSKINIVGKHIAQVA